MLYMHDFMTFMCVWHMKGGNFAISLTRCCPPCLSISAAFLQTPCPDPVIVQVSGSVGCTEGERAIDWTLVQGVFEVLQTKKNIIVNVHLKGMALYGFICHHNYLNFIYTQADYFFGQCCRLNVCNTFFFRSSCYREKKTAQKIGLK